jgi:phage baseplate assembly protein V
MPNGLIESATQSAQPTDRRIYGVALAQVIDNVDVSGLGRVQVRLPWLPGVEPWARVAVLMAGSSRGTYFIPQVGDEVLVAFSHGESREPYIIGCLWNTQDRPPAPLPTDAINKRVIHTPLGHDIELDDATQSITITSSTQQKITIDPGKIELTTTGNTASVKLETTGAISIQAARSIEIKAPTITIQGGTVDVTSTASTNINGGPACNVQAALIRIN